MELLPITQLKRLNFILLVLLVSFGCMTYELILAQINSVMLGNALLNYSMTIGVFLAALGLGSWVVSTLPPETEQKTLLLAEISLSFLGPLLPALAILTEFLLRRWMGPGHAEFHLVFQLSVYALAFLVGVLCGLELPLLILWGAREFALKSGLILALDYLGTLAAVVFFPLVGLYQLGLFGISSCAAAASWGCAGLTLVALRKVRGWQLAALATSLALLLFLVIGRTAVSDFLTNTLYLDGIHG